MASEARDEETGKADISAEEKRHLDDLDGRLSSMTPWELLALTGDPTGADIKRAYLNATKRYHPDRYYGKSIGAYRARLERIFRAVKTAYDVLSNPAECAKYRSRVPPPVVAEKAAAQAEVDRDKVLEARRQQIIAERRQKMAMQSGPRVSEDVRRKAQDLFDLGAEQIRNEQLPAAVSSFRLAVSFDPSVLKYRVSLELAQGTLCEAQSDLGAAKIHFETANRLDPANTHATKTLEQLSRRSHRK